VRRIVTSVGTIFTFLVATFYRKKSGKPDKFGSKKDGRESVGDMARSRGKVAAFCFMGWGWGKFVLFPPQFLRWLF